MYNNLFPSFSEKEISIINNKTFIHDKVVQVLKFIYDPDIKKVSIWDLGLIYKIHYPQVDHVDIIMTLTSSACPLANAIQNEVKTKIIKHVKKIATVNVMIVFDPKWNKDMMTDEAKFILEIF